MWWYVYNRGSHNQTCVIIFGSINNGKRRTANNESDVNAFAGVKSPPSRENSPNDTTITMTGILLRINMLHCKTKKRVRQVVINKRKMTTT